MSKKKLLEESTIRSFMKLANLQPLTAKFLKESEEEEGEGEGEGEEDLDESTAPPDTKDSAGQRDRMEEEVVEEEGAALEEEVAEEGEMKEEGKDTAEHSAPKTSPKASSPKGKSLTAKPTQGVDGAKTVKSPGKLKPLKAGTHHSDKPDSIETKGHSNAPKKNNSQFEVVSESLEEMEMGQEELDAPEAPEAGGEELGSAGESGDHQQKMKDLIRGMLDTLKNMGEEYGMSMEISDDSGGAGEEEPSQAGEMEPSEEPQAGEALEEMVERLTKRVAARLVKETKKKR